MRSRIALKGAVLRRNLKRAEFGTLFAKLAPTEVALEACGSSHHWARVLTEHGHQVRLVPPQYVKPFVKRGKNDSADAEAICEAARRPGMHFVPGQSAEPQAAATPLSVRELLVRQRTQLVNALRGHSSEFGIIAGRGTHQIDALLEQITASDTVPQTAREMLALLGQQIAHVDATLTTMEKRLVAEHRADPRDQGPSHAVQVRPTLCSLAAPDAEAAIDWRQTASGRHQQGRQRAAATAVRGGCHGVIRQARPGSKTASPWLLQSLERRPRKLAAVALANKMARTAWATMTNGEAWRMPKASAVI